MIGRGLPEVYAAQVASSLVGYVARERPQFGRVRLTASGIGKPYGRRLATTNRVAAMAAFVFIAWHFWEIRVQAWRGLDPSAFYATLAWRLSSTWHGFPVRAVLYILGVAATVSHLAISAWGYGVTSGFFATKRQKRRAGYACAGIGALLFVVATSTVVSLATGLEFSPAHHGTKECNPPR